MVSDNANVEYFSRARKYFYRGYIENPKFWSRLGGEPSFDDLKVLDIGCGTGSLCVDIATKGAKKVVGIDINKRVISFADENLTRFFPHLKKKIDFLCCSISCINICDFDMIVSKDTFEHILNLDRELIEMKKRLKAGGKVYVGFGPLYHSFSGDHGRTKTLIPWGHLLIPESILVRRINRRRKEKITNIYELGLNKLSLEQFLLLFKKTGFVVSYFRVNANALGRGHEKVFLRVFSLLRRVSALEKYFSYNFHCILENKRKANFCTLR